MMDGQCLGYLVIGLAYEYAQNLWNISVSMGTDNNSEMAEEISVNTNIRNNDNVQVIRYIEL